MHIRQLVVSLTASLAALGATAARADLPPGTFLIPGTDTTLKIYGYAQLDTTIDAFGRAADIENFDWATILPAVPDDGKSQAKRPQVYLTARTSRFGFQTKTPTSFGPLEVKVEGDFNGPNNYQSETWTNSVLFRLRHAYGTFAGFLVGQTWSTFLDLGAYPDVVDFNGPGSIALVRNPMIRYTFNFGSGLTLALAAENARGSQFDGSKYASLPDFHANLTWAGGWGHVSLRGVTQQYNYNYTDTNGTSQTSSVFTGGGAVSGAVKILGDSLVYQAVGGPGMGRYVFNAFGAIANLDSKDPTSGLGYQYAGAVFLNPKDNSLNPVNVFSYHVGYTHVWSPTWRSNAVFSQTWLGDPNVAGTGTNFAGSLQQHYFTQLFINTFWTFFKTAEVGLEYDFGQWVSYADNTGTKHTGTMHRVNLTFHYNFF